LIKLKRAYNEPAKEDGFRILVERLWPRGVTKERARIDLWLKDISPSSELRTWYSHDVAKWPQFRERYYAELKTKKDLIQILKQKIKEGPVTFVYAARDEEHNSALALKSFIENS
jgi:uncharacterized protein YeaO (DUF488 family)